jgi:hypothetical protein
MTCGTWEEAEAMHARFVERYQGCTKDTRDG